MTLTLMFKLALAVSMLVVGAVLQSADAQNATAVTVVTTAETVAVVGQPCSVPGGTCKVSIKALIVFSPGTNTTSVAIKIYRGTTAAGTLVSASVNQAGNFTAGNSAPFTMTAVDALANAGQAQYCVTVTGNGASANGTINTATIETMVLSG